LNFSKKIDFCSKFEFLLKIFILKLIAPLKNPSFFEKVCILTRKHEFKFYFSGPNGFARTNAAYNSFRRQLSITERKQDPQTAIINEPPPTTNPKAALEESLFKPRPAPNPSLFDRQVKFSKLNFKIKN
jgi:hypothetical protein